MTELKKAKQQVAQARQQAQEQRELVEQRRQEAQKTQEQIREQEQKLPEPSQRLLRQGMLSGLEGRKRRQALSKVKGQLGEETKKVDIFKGELTKFEEKELKPFEQQVKQREGEIKEYEKHQSAIRLAEDVFYGSKDGRVFFFGANPLARKYYDRMRRSAGGDYKTLKALSEQSPTLSSEALKPTPTFTAGGLGGVFLKPSESHLAEGLAQKTGATIIIPETKQTFTPATGWTYNPRLDLSKPFEQFKPFPQKTDTLKKIVVTPFKFLTGELQWQKDLEEGRFKQARQKSADIEQKYLGRTITKVHPTETDPYGYGQTYSTLIEGQDYPTLIRKGYAGGGEKLFGVSDKIRIALFGGDPAAKDIQRFGGELIGGLALGYSFSPVFSTGAKATKQKTISEQLQKGRFDELGKGLKKIDVDDAKLELLFKKSGKTLKTKTQSDKVQDLRKALELSKSKNQREAIVKFFRETLGEDDFKFVAKDYLSQEGVRFKPTPEKTFNIKDYYSNLIIETPPKMKYAGVTTGILSGFDTNKFKVVPATNQFQQFFSPTGEALKEEQKTILKQDEKERSKIVFFPKLTPKIKLDEKVTTAPKLTPLLKEGLATKQITIPKLKTPTKTTAKKLPFLKTPRIKKPIKKIFPISDFKPTSSTKEIDEKTFFKVFKRIKGEDFKVSQKETEFKAFEELKKELDKDLSASGFIERAGEKIKIPFADWGRFRQAKKDPFRLVEKREFRLSTFGERTQIQRARQKKKKRGFF